MNRPALAIVLALAATSALAQENTRTMKVVDVRWVDVFDSQGNRTLVPVFARSASDPNPQWAGRMSSGEATSVLKTDEQWRQANLAHDVPAMERILSDDFFETIQDGSSRNKPEALRRWSALAISSLHMDRATIRLSGNVATITGEQSETTAAGTDTTLFIRTYVQSPSNAWMLLSSTQFQSPKER